MQSDLAMDGEFDRQHSAVETAVSEIRLLIASGFLNNNREYMKAWLRFQLEYSKKGYITIPENLVEELADLARTDSDVLRLAALIIATRIRVAAPLPKPFRELAGDLISGEINVQKRRGRPSTWGRDFIIHRTVSRLLNQDYVDTAMENVDRKSTGSLSACRVVERALPQTAVGAMSLETIQRIWSNNQNSAEYHETNGLYWAAAFDDAPEVRRV